LFEKIGGDVSPLEQSAYDQFVKEREREENERIENKKEAEEARRKSEQKYFQAQETREEDRAKRELDKLDRIEGGCIQRVGAFPVFEDEL
jgi:predicted ATP-dependent serine protease